MYNTELWVGCQCFTSLLLQWQWMSESDYVTNCWRISLSNGGVEVGCFDKDSSVSGRAIMDLEGLIGPLEFFCSYSSLIFFTIGCIMKPIIEYLVCGPLRLTYFNLCLIACIPWRVFPFYPLLFKKCLPAPHLIFLSWGVEGPSLKKRDCSCRCLSPLPSGDANPNGTFVRSACLNKLISMCETERCC